MSSDIKFMNPPEGKSLVYIVRPSVIGFAINFTVTCDDITIGKTKGKNFLYAILNPGPHVFVSKGENSSELHLILEVGKTYFIEQKVRMGLLYARNKIQLINEKEGRNKLDKCNLSKNQNPQSNWIDQKEEREKYSINQEMV